MKKVLCSFGFGSHSRLLALSVPTFYLYANNHNYDVFIPNINFFDNNTKDRPPSWWKLKVIEKLFEEYDQVLWLDADVIICRFEEDIFQSLEDQYDTGIVVHETPDGYIPNCGVWLLNKNCMNWLPELWNFNHFSKSDGWWEQAALLHMFGVNPDNLPIVLPETCPIAWKQLDYSWNPHIHDPRKIPADTRFFHATMFQDRYMAMKNILQQIDI